MQKYYNMATLKIFLTLNQQLNTLTYRTPSYVIIQALRTFENGQVFANHA